MSASGKYKPEKYLEFLGLSRNPFPMAPDNTDFFLSRHNDIVINRLVKAVLSRKGFMLLTGEIGLGKTTLSRRVIEVLEKEHVETALVLQSFYQGKELLQVIIEDFGISLAGVSRDLSGLMQHFNTFLMEKRRAGINCVILIDDAQNLSVKSLELVRMISNLEADREKLVQVLLVGQPELIETLNTHALRQLKSRLTEIQSTVPLDKNEMEKYLQFKMTMAGDSGRIIIKSAALDRLYHLTQGNIRQINVLMDHVLSTMCEDNSFTVQSKYVDSAFKHLDLNAPEKTSLNRWIWAGLIGFILGLAGILAGAGVYYLWPGHRTPETPLAAVVHPVPNSKFVLDQAPVQSQETHQTDDSFEPISPVKEISGVMTNWTAGKTKGPEASAAMVSFLETYDLSDFALGLETAINENQTEDIARQIKARTGLQMICLEQLPDVVKQRYDILIGPGITPDAKMYYLFWQPTPQIDRFYLGYQGQEITLLQQQLNRHGMYPFHIDGIVGQRLQKSVKKFQKQMDLDITGFPDPETVFLLANSQNRTFGKGKKETNNE